VHGAAPEAMVGTIQMLRITAAHPNSLAGELADPPHQEKHAA
jgi:hypothetical protein